MGSEVAFAQLFLQSFVEGGGVGERDFLGLFVAAAIVFLELVVGDVVLVEVVAQRVVVGIAAVFFADGRFFGRADIFFLSVGFLTSFFEGRVFQKFSPNAVFQLHGGKFQQFHYQNLLGRERLYLLLRLGLYLSGALCHIFS